MKSLALVVMLLLPVASYAQAQDCTLKYLGVNSSQAEEGEPSLEADPQAFFGMSERVNESYETTNTFKLYSLDVGRTMSGQNVVINIFEITCVTPE